MNPDSAELRRPEASINLLVKKVRDGLILKGKRDDRAGLIHQSAMSVTSSRSSVSAIPKPATSVSP